jgi:hypothetical protein
MQWAIPKALTNIVWATGTAIATSKKNKQIKIKTKIKH